MGGRCDTALHGILVDRVTAFLGLKFLYKRLVHLDTSFLLWFEDVHVVWDF